MPLPLDILNIIASFGLSYYRRLLNLPRFARSTLHRQLYWQPFYTLHEITCDGEKWTIGGKLHRIQTGPNAGPALFITAYGRYDETNIQAWYFNGQLHRSDPTLPAHIRTVTRNHAIVNCIKRQWYYHGKKHRVNGPASIYDDHHEKWYLHGQKHRVDGPAVRRYYDDGFRSQEEWWFDGLLHRADDKPAHIGSFRREWWFQGKKHRETGPAVIHTNGNEEWWFNGNRHRIDAPAFTTEDGREEWYYHGMYHRPQEGPTTGPAIIYYDENNFQCQEWWIHGKQHRDNAPAIIKQNEEYWYQHGKVHRPLFGPNAGPAYRYIKGPGSCHPNGEHHELYYIHGELYTPADLWSIALLLEMAKEP
jgi:hypothetical protein